VAETACLLNMCTGDRTGGSNPPLSAIRYWDGFPGTIASTECRNFAGCSVARLSRLVWDEEVAGSNPATPTKKANLVYLVGLFYIKLLSQKVTTGRVAQLDRASRFLIGKVSILEVRNLK
jgi:hypothetical protein